MIFSSWTTEGCETWWSLSSYDSAMILSVHSLESDSEEELLMDIFLFYSTSSLLNILLLRFLFFKDFFGSKVLFF